MIREQIGSKDFLETISQAMNAASSKEESFTVEAKHTGPALNITIEKKSFRKTAPLVKNLMGNLLTYLDADFTLALSCPNFPSDGKCKFLLFLFSFLTK